MGAAQRQHVCSVSVCARGRAGVCRRPRLLACRAAFGRAPRVQGCSWPRAQSLMPWPHLHVQVCVAEAVVRDLRRGGRGTAGVACIAGGMCAFCCEATAMLQSAEAVVTTHLDLNVSGRQRPGLVLPQRKLVQVRSGGVAGFGEPACLVFLCCCVCVHRLVLPAPSRRACAPQSPWSWWPGRRRRGGGARARRRRQAAAEQPWQQRSERCTERCSWGAPRRQLEKASALWPGSGLGPSAAAVFGLQLRSGLPTGANCC